MNKEILDLIDELYEKGRENGISFFLLEAHDSAPSWSASVSNSASDKDKEFIGKFISFFNKI